MWVGEELGRSCSKEEVRSESMRVSSENSSYTYLVTAAFHTLSPL